MMISSSTSLLLWVLTSIPLSSCLQQSQRPPRADIAVGKTSRRAFTAGLLTGSLSFLQLQQPAVAASTASSSSLEEDKQKIVQGYRRLTSLLDNWEQETTECGKRDNNPYVTGGGCDRTPLKVMDYLGYKNIKDPLFKAEKTLRRLEVLVPAEKEVEFLNAVEQWVETADEGSGMAYVSSWGEANPGGGKDRVEFYIERAKNNVIMARESLKTVLDILEIKV